MFAMNVDTSRRDLVGTSVEFSQRDPAKGTVKSTEEHDHRDPFGPTRGQLKGAAPRRGSSCDGAGCDVARLGAGTIDAIVVMSASRSS
jgi:hypothetical protein